jgi:hypothetical protein
LPFGIGILGKQVHFILFGHALEMLDVELERLPNLKLKLIVKTFALELLLYFRFVVIYESIFEILVIEIVEIPGLLFQGVPQAMEGLDFVPVEVSQNGVRHDQIGQDVTIFDDVDLVESKEVVDHEQLANLFSSGHF